MLIEEEVALKVEVVYLLTLMMTTMSISTCPFSQMLHSKIAVNQYLNMHLLTKFLSDFLLPSIISIKNLFYQFKYKLNMDYNKCS